MSIYFNVLNYYHHACRKLREKLFLVIAIKISKFLENTNAYWTESELYNSKHYCEMKIGEESLTCLGEL